ARVAAVAEFDAPYDDVSPSEALEGDDFVRLFFDAFMNPTIQEFIMYFFHYMGVDIYISETCYRVFLKVRKCTEEEWKVAVEALYSKQRKESISQ
ncbi:MAG: hypothetical protein IJX63_16195, partial [Lachnospiraceae bacterium]|nr:hypothetical protein [Lachnospiraceae bacterium]